ncbi:Hypothetical protein CpMEX30_0264 [Corynebacterium pseudotuberculosis]|uniref:Uncharacterized protein n=1 Tax=Corynebacterium pseudotuberculosis 258 TaxID=1168865 RepID=A0AAX1FKH5_CORPS|nr:hypothetical protein CPCIP5297_01290 [Corynebacterium pseudotuberculosis CIP 52.97]AER68341.1 Hypothetical protein Cp106_0233 [Corynebacterium pseudotuberculosis 1/06-A]AFB71580.2 hypothetical protein CP316_01285 [Corynebacterium pseudotuberculosis 316]AFH90081.2 hypothetical protein CP31_01505 [Corynebacterium pseudotuberculosis 31]APQ53371.1 Hypothetical protein CpMEX30_0264 [Corynebacterium pseudotuberculosis]QGW56930.1 hypothetical protein CP258_01290 [Corynebacterium pseudotuberculosis
MYLCPIRNPPTNKKPHLGGYNAPLSLPQNGALIFPFLRNLTHAILEKTLYEQALEPALRTKITQALSSAMQRPACVITYEFLLKQPD